MIESDSIARVTVRDLFIVLALMEHRSETTLENIRLRLCVDREKKRKGNFLWSAARDVSGELQRLALVVGASYPKDARQYEQMSDNNITITDEGRSLLKIFRDDRGAAYDDLFMRMVARHPYLQTFVRVVQEKDLLAPVISSLRDHVSPEYSSTAKLAEDVVNKCFESESLLQVLTRRLQRKLSASEAKNITQGLDQLLIDARPSAMADEAARFAKNFVNKLNDLIIPEVFRADGMPFDFRTHRTLWTVGQEFLTWFPTRSHPSFDCWLIFPTADVRLGDGPTRVESVTFNSGLEKTRQNFLGKLFECYQKVQSINGSTFINAWELRAVFCHDNRCQPSVFNRLFGETAGGSLDYKLHLEIQRQKPQHEESLRAGSRNIGTIRVVRS